MSIKICVITPISHLEVYGSMGEMDMSLSHLIVENPKGPYTQYYKKQREKGRFVILDNSAFELEQLGRGLDPDPVLDAAEVTNPTEVIATDVLFNGAATIESTKKFLKRIEERGLQNKYMVMGVVQGKTRDEWQHCFTEMLELPVNTIGLSKLSVPQSFLGERESLGCVARSRVLCTDWIARYILTHDLRGKKIHLLGGDNWTAWEMKQQSKFWWIRSNDSSCAVWYGIHDLVFDSEGKIEEILLEKPDLENKCHHTRDSLNQDHKRAYIMENVAKWHMAAKSK